MDKKELEKALEDIHYIKEIISRDNSLIQKFLESKGLRYLSLIFGVVLSTISFLAYFSFSGQAGYSLLFKWILAISIIILVIVTAIMKWKIWNFLFPENPLPFMLIRIVGIPILKVVILLLFLIIGFSIGFSIVRLYQYILPVWAIGGGLFFCIYGSFFDSSLALELTGYFIITSGCISLFFIHNKPVEAWLWSGIIFGIGFLIYFVVATLSSLTKREKSE